MKKCVIKGKEPYSNINGEPMFSTTGSRYYKSTGSLTVAVVCHVHKHDGTYVVQVSDLETNVHAKALGSIFNTENQENLPTHTEKGILSVSDLSDIDKLKRMQAGTLELAKVIYDNNPDVHFEYKEKARNSADLTVLKNNIISKNKDIFNQCEQKVKSINGLSNEQIKGLTNRTYLKNKIMMSRVSVSINVSIHHNVYTDNFAVDNIGDKPLMYENYKYNGGTYTCRSNNDKSFTIPCNSMEHAKKLINLFGSGFSELFDKVYTENGLLVLVDTDNRTAEQIKNDQSIVNQKGLDVKPEDLANSVKDNSTTIPKHVLEELELNKSYKLSDGLIRLIETKTNLLEGNKVKRE